ncbi:MAG: peptidoglycan-associated lipoprotein Pal [Deinococcus-Thermus bacterium]|jgi:peptidoglycan-associated lipoprotein|nr:peptidoglycan-associated lipoprotein Pal [Deinococcota bacterium]
MRVKLLSLLAVLVLAAGCAGETTEQPEATTGPDTAGQAGAPAPGTVAEFVEVVGDRVFFGFDRSDLSANARATLDRQAEWLREYPEVQVQIEGHTDERGTRNYNLALGDRRATAVRNYMVALGIDPARISTISYGEERPVALGSNEEAWAQNRRAVTVVTSGAPSS